ncbi:MAG: glycine/betaine/sarcosine/D-proline family reductase selenoprotein B [Burkholderiales bacterium]|nr:glycine/betaine/sarcosine/D-proline family reductase selenoprotein B [Burkholderiales bacterium]
MATRLRVIHYLNQFFGGIGGEDKADARPTVKAGAVGPGALLQKHLGDGAEVVATVICGDSYFGEHTDEALAEVLKLVAAQRPDLVVAGPAFAAGRYGVACGAVCGAAREKLKVPAVTAMHPENPGVELSRRRAYILPAGGTAMDMAAVMARIAPFALKLARGETIGPADLEGYLPTGTRRNEFDAKSGAERMVEMLLDRLNHRPFTSEVELPRYDQVNPAAALAGLEGATIALVTTSGVVPQGNPDRIESWRATKWVRYPIGHLQEIGAAEWTCVHGGYDNGHVRQDPRRAVPLDILRELEREGRIGKVLPYLYTTVGNVQPVERARRFGREIAASLRQEGVHAALFTAT